MPVAAVAAAAITAGSTIYGASQSKKAANKAADAQNTAAQQQIAAQQQALDKIIALNAPTIQGGQQAYQALLQQFGITGAAPAAQPAPALSYDATGNVVRAPMAATAPMTSQAPKTEGGFAGTSPLASPAALSATASGGGVDYARLFQDRPDVMAEYQKVAAQADPNSPQFQKLGLDRGAEGFADYWLANKPAQDTYAAPTTAAQPAATQAPTAQAQTQPAAVDPNAAPNLMNAARPTAAAAPDFTGQAPDLNSFFSNFEADPGAAYRRSEALSGVNAASAARGKLRSGDAVKALATLSSDLASQEYNNWFGRQNTLYNNSRNAFQNDRAYDTGIWQYGVDRGDSNFNTDRGYQTQQDNTRIGNLFDLAKMGTNAAGNVSGAASANANNQSSIFGSQAQNASDAAYAKANANAGAVGSLAGTATNLFANWGGGGTQTNAAQPFNRTGFNQWALGTW